MLKNYFTYTFVYLFCLQPAFTLLANDSWIPFYLECRCFANDEVQCLKDVEKQFGFSAELLINRTPTHLQRSLADKMLSKMNKDRSILRTQYEHYKKQENQNKAQCIASKLNSLENVIQQSLFQRSHLAREAMAYTLLSGLSGLARQIYSEAYHQCFGGKTVAIEKLVPSVPALNSCRQTR